MYNNKEFHNAASRCIGVPSARSLLPGKIVRALQLFGVDCRKFDVH